VLLLLLLLILLLLLVLLLSLLALGLIVLLMILVLAEPYLGDHVLDCLATTQQLTRETLFCHIFGEFVAENEDAAMMGKQSKRSA